MTTHPNRRAFLAGSTASLAAGLTVFSAPSRAKTAASERVNVAVMGIRGRGRSLAAGFAELDQAQVTHLIDVDTRLFDEVASDVEKRQGQRPETVEDFRRVLDNPNVDALVIATPDHWHAPATVLACQAGKHVYVEKPASHTLWEGRKMVEAARKYERVVQVGTQSRSAPHYQDVIRALRSGRIGDVLQAKAWNSQYRPNLTPWIEAQRPEGVNYDLWLGPAPKQPFHPNRFHYTWHWFWDYGTGDMGNDGIHDIDIARWGLDVGLPQSVSCTALKARNHHWETPDTVSAWFTFPESVITLIFEQRDWSPYTQQGYENGVAFFGTEGYILVGRSGWRLFLSNDEQPVESKPFSDRHHFDNFLEAIRNNSALNADIEDGHRSAALAHLANIAFKTGRHGLTFDPETETIVGDTEAQALTTKQYRKPFVVPEEV